AIEAALTENGDSLLSTAERAEIDEGMATLRRTLEGSNHQLIKKQIESLNHISEMFAGRRMDQSVQKALSGHKLEELEI
ncbi:MAG: Fe-S protein assembly chaperone HscA, partial [Sulfuricella sp.]